MSIYIPCLNETRDGICGCGAPATTEVQCGWHNADHQGQPSGGQYEEICEACYSQTDEAQGHRRAHFAILRYVRDGKFVRGEDGIYRGPRGMNHGQEDHERLMVELAAGDPAEIEAAVKMGY